ncbi:hypothetical protein [Amycolatopsis sp. H20-H5]|uniref:hypothetical protein n=1 Tax=Amycolatopsis sp. H20-H5 TaxID=3046309 RepID=UPI002DBE5906|nr:hypothetical protein [Amycolatopsis sp. H20-H5]MEC3982397.1 hypothetical protein [Amycolatopsis sp. H20-H5]
MRSLDTGYRGSARAPHQFRLLDEEADDGSRVGEADRLSISEILLRLPSLPMWSVGDTYDRRSRMTGARRILEWLETQAGEGWQQRWALSGAADGMDQPWLTRLAEGDSRAPVTARNELAGGVMVLLLARVVLPSYAFLASYSATRLDTYTRLTFRPDLFARIEATAESLDLPVRQFEDGLVVLSKIVLQYGQGLGLSHCGRSDRLSHVVGSTQDRHQFGSTKPHVAWRLLKGIVDLGHDTMLEALRFGQSSVPEMVDSYEVACGPVRDILVRYLRERQSAMDYASLRSLARNLVKLFWTDIELHHPGITTLHLDDEIAAAWKQRLMVVRKPDGTISHAGSSVMFCSRSGPSRCRRGCSSAVLPAGRMGAPRTQDAEHANPAGAIAP